MAMKSVQVPVVEHSQAQRRMPECGLNGKAGGF